MKLKIFQYSRIFFLLTAGFLNAQIKLPAIFGNDMVLQQKTFAPIWGKTTPEQTVFVNTSWGSSARTVAGSDSLWIAKIKTPKAGGPYEVTIHTERDTIIFSNVMIGEVWICSGQSNMEMPLEGWLPGAPVEGSEEAIKNSANSKIRFFTVARSISDKPEFNCAGTWAESNPKTAARFSATAYFFGKKLYDELKIPIGLINTSWGGTPIESWISGKRISQIDKYKSVLENIQSGKTELQALTSWMNTKPIIDISKREKNSRWQNLHFNDSTCSSIEYDDSHWKEMNLPGLWENTEVGNFDGVVWFRKKIEVPDTWLNKELILELGPIDDMDVTYINGVKIGSSELDGLWKTDRIYTVLPQFVKEKILTIAVRVVDTGGGGGLWGSPEQLKLHLKDSDEKISLAGNWKYIPVAEYSNEKLYVYGSTSEEYQNRPQQSFDFSANSPTTLYNGMISPLIPFSIKGAIWYQGEANAQSPELYNNLLQLMISNWRNDWNEKNFPFYFTQIAPFNYSRTVQSQKLREAQFFSLSTPKTGMVVTLDIGNSENIHPAKKREVGSRLALWALAKDYGKKLVHSGPLYKSMKISGGRIILTFDYANGLKIKLSNEKNNFLIAGADSIFKEADVKIKGKTVVVSSPEIKNPIAVRYCWGNILEATLFNKNGLPASSFRTDSWK